MIPHELLVHSSIASSNGLEAISDEWLFNFQRPPFSDTASLGTQEPWAASRRRCAWDGGISFNDSWENGTKP